MAMSTISKKNDNYLRSQPYCSPDELAKQSDRLRSFSDKLAAQSAQLRRWTVYLAGAGFAVVFLAVVAVVVTISFARPSSATGAAPVPTLAPEVDIKKEPQA